MYAVVICLLVGAPVPKYKAPVLDITPGVYCIFWGGGNPKYVTLKSDGHYEWPWFDGIHKGTWQYDRKTKTLHMYDTSNLGFTWTQYNFKLCPELKTGIHTYRIYNEDGTSYECQYKIDIHNRFKLGAKLPDLPSNLN